METDKAKDIERRIAELKQRWPAHSAPPGMWQELEDLEDELKKVESLGTEETDGRQDRGGRLS